ncbi:hypothetical protein EH243_01300 [Amphritea opalescens]|uniref:Uncharacterized protein n=1 Tax=Amphritea opalescens TaxID=2490544 RepID=A0A430KVV4_9GAMM|nr:hypothetical protein [Amphritea opalescens]RTE67612.1 hypothetical protein EH243_01300 [Amphritea opalescens]
MNSPIWAAVSGWELNAELEGPNALNIETLFIALEGKGLIYDGPHKSILLQHYNRFVAANPNNLRHQVQRVYLAILCHDSDELVGALVDLLITLDGRGKALQQRLLEQGESLLSEADLALFKDSVAQGDNQQLLSLNKPKSVLCNGDFSLH